MSLLALTHNNTRQHDLRELALTISSKESVLLEQLHHLDLVVELGHVNGCLLVLVLQSPETHNTQKALCN